MKTKLAYIAILFFLSIQFGTTQTIIYSGPVSGLWSYNESPYIIRGSIYIDDQKSLEIEAGVEIIFQTTDPFFIHGTLLAEGNITDSILFTTDRPERGWGGIRFEDISNSNQMSKLKYCRLEHAVAKGNWPYHAGGAIGIKYTNNISISNCLFQYNKALQKLNEVGSGGAIAIWLSEVRITNCEFRYNEAQRGGAIFITKYSKAIIDNSLFHHNTASLEGGAVEVSDFAIPTFINSTFADNFAAKNGGAFNISSSGSPVLLNCIVYDNLARMDGDQINLAGTASYFRLLHSNIEGGTSGIANYFYDTDKQIYISEDPQFEHKGNLAYALPTYSPAVNAGTTNPIYLPYGFEFSNFDMAGNPRSSGSSIDMGYLETMDEIRPEHITNIAANIGTPIWTPYTHTGNNNNLNDVFFIDDNTGWAVGDGGTVIFTSNGGLKWNEVRVSGRVDLHSVHFTSESVGYVTASTSGGPSTLGLVYMTINGGLNWEPVYVGNEEMVLEDVIFTDSDKGFVSGNRIKGQEETKLLLTTLDGGTTWTEMDMPKSMASLSSIHFSDGNNGYLSGSIYVGPAEVNAVLKTANGGATWNSVYIGKEKLNISKALFSKDNHGFLIGENGAVSSITNNGTLRRQFNLGRHNLNSMLFTKASELVIIGDYGMIYNTVDNGKNWTQEIIDFQSNLNEIIMTEAGTLWAVGDNGLVISRPGLELQDTANELTGNQLSLKKSIKNNTINSNPIITTNNYPNPFKGKTTISWELEQAAKVNISIYGINGKLIEILEDRRLESGQHTTEFNAFNLTPGMYIYVIKADNFVEKGKMLVSR